MTYIFIDFEMNQLDATTRRQLRDALKHEIIEIGAVKVDDKGNEIDSYKAYVKPTLTPINDHITKLTGITNEMVEDAPTFADALDKFIPWCEDADVVYAWSENDLNQLNKECKFKKYSHPDFAVLTGKWKDFQKEYGTMIGTKKRIALENAVFYLGNDFEGTQHDALWDARNTATIFKLSLNRAEFERIMKPVMDIYRPHQNLTYGLANLLKDIKIDEE